MLAKKSKHSSSMYNRVIVSVCTSIYPHIDNYMSTIYIPSVCSSVVDELELEEVEADGCGVPVIE